MLDRNINAIIYKAYIKLGELAYQLAKNANDGLEGTKAQKLLWQQALIVYSFLDVIGNHIVVQNNTVYQIRGITIQEMNKLLVTLKDAAKIYDFPVAPFIPVKDFSIILVGSVPGPPGSNGQNAYIAIAYAEDNIGTGISIIPDPTRPYFAFKNSNSPIIIEAASFTGLWQLINVVIPSFTTFENNDVDIGTEPCDSFDLTLATGVDWDYTIVKGTNRKKGRLSVSWNGTTPQVSEDNTVSIGTIDVSLDADISEGLVRLLATSTSNDWKVSGNRTLIK
jgi:hypothetical protein